MTFWYQNSNGFIIYSIPDLLTSFINKICFSSQKISSLPGFQGRRLIHEKLFTAFVDVSPEETDQKSPFEEDATVADVSKSAQPTEEVSLFF